MDGTKCISYQWSSGSTIAGPSGLASGTYTLTVTDVNGCTAIYTVYITLSIAINVSAFSDTTLSSILVTVSLLPVAAYSITPLQGAALLDVTFISNTSGSNSYTWNFGDTNFLIYQMIRILIR